MHYTAVLKSQKLLQHKKLQIDAQFYETFLCKNVFSSCNVSQLKQSALYCLKLQVGGEHWPCNKSLFLVDRAMIVILRKICNVAKIFPSLFSQGVYQQKIPSVMEVTPPLKMHQMQSIFMQLLESPIPPLTAAHLIVGGYF